MTLEVSSDEPAAWDFITSFYSLYRAESQKGIVLRKDGEVIAATLYVENNGSNIFMHCAAKPGRRWLNRDFLYWVFHYPFEQCGVRRITCWVEASNVDCHRFIKHIGFTHEATLAQAAADGGDVFIYVMHKEHCQHVSQVRLWRRQRHG